MVDDEECKSKIFHFSLNLIRLFLETTEASDKRDFVLLKKLNEHLVTEIESAIIENKKCKVSKNFEEIFKEWESTLYCYRATAMLGVEIAELFQKGQFNEELITKNKKYTEQGKTRLKKVLDLIYYTKS